MQLLGHLGLAVLVYSPVAYLVVRRGRPRQAWLGLAGVLAVSMTPDVDLYLASVPHRGVTHTVWTALLVGGTMALVARRAGASSEAVRTDGGRPGVGRVHRARFGAVVGGSGVASHLFGDVLTPMGIRPFYPLSETTYTLSLVSAADPGANLSLFAAGVATFALAVARARAPARLPTAEIRPEGSGRS